MNYYEHHIGDYIKATAHLSMLEDAAYRRLIDAYYTKEAPLPAERKACHRLARATSKPERDAVDTILNEFFTLADDGWHQSRCDEEIAKYVEKRPAAEEKREHDKERQRRARERRKQLFEELARHGISLPFNSTTEALQAEVSRVTNRDQSQPVTQPVTRDNTLTHTPVPSPQSPDLKPNPEESASTPPQDGTPQGRVCARLRRLGIQGVNPSNPKLIGLLADGVPENEFCDLAEEPIAKGKGLAWILAAVEGRRRDAAARTAIPIEAPRQTPTCGICGHEAVKQISRVWYCSAHDQFSERVAA